MATNAHTERWAHRAGCKVGRAWRGVVRQDRRAIEWFVKHGWPTGLAKAMLWITKLAVLGVLLYTAFWLTLLFVLALLVTCGIANSDQGDEQVNANDEWRFGESGYGLYSSGGQRIDPHDPNDPYDE
ncbi:DUF3742 family protein [Porticoccus sp.]|jgi:hypothetical protein|uniref:DUF3742 family protein n=1 Tax=Porticoccus sp. TaxID=2024853 RepID=UPI000C4CE191|nr:DUF3742 family protein [Porticoccus sp.]MAZ69285.1 hypothetical protein [Porticoccus sp.]